MVRSAVALIIIAGLTLSRAASPANDEAAPASTAVPSAGGLSGLLGTDDAAIAEWLRRLIENDIYQHVPRKEDRPSIEAFYRNRSFAPIWISNGSPQPRVREAIKFLRDVSTDGLDPSDYAKPYFTDRGAYRLAADELMLTNSVVTFARHARLGRVEPPRLGGKIQFDPPEPRPSDILSRLAEVADDVRTTLDSLLPQQPEYKALKAALASERSEGGAKRSKGGAQSRIDTIIANMERWRWLPRDLGAAYVMVNLPDYTLKVVDHGKTLWSTRIVVGKAGSSSTPLFSQVITRIVVNPVGIAAAAPIARKTVGSRSAAGHIHFEIPSKSPVTQGDAPATLFSKNERVHGSSVILVEDALQYAQVLLSITRPGDGFTVESIRELYGDREQSIPFENSIPIHVSYQTAFVDEAGKLQSRPDIYGYDRDIISLMRGDRNGADGLVVNKRDIPRGIDERIRGAVSSPTAPRPARSPFAFPLD